MNKPKRLGEFGVAVPDPLQQMVGGITMDVEYDVCTWRTKGHCSIQHCLPGCKSLFIFPHTDHNIAKMLDKDCVSAYIHTHTHLLPEKRREREECNEAHVITKGPISRISPGFFDPG